jgi:hypothetical protein
LENNAAAWAGLVDADADTVHHLETVDGGGKLKRQEKAAP